MKRGHSQVGADGRYYISLLLRIPAEVRLGDHRLQLINPEQTILPDGLVFRVSSRGG